MGTEAKREACKKIMLHKYQKVYRKEIKFGNETKEKMEWKMKIVKYNNITPKKCYAMKRK